jgi:hypothetical protein
MELAGARRLRAGALAIGCENARDLQRPDALRKYFYCALDRQTIERL